MFHGLMDAFGRAEDRRQAEAVLERREMDGERLEDLLEII